MPFDFIQELANTLRKDEHVEIDASETDRVNLLVMIPSIYDQFSFAERYNIDILEKIGLRMDWDDTVRIQGWKTKSKPPSEYFTRTEIFRIVIESTPRQYHMYAHLGLSLKPAQYTMVNDRKLLVKAGETFTMPSGGKFDGLALCAFAFENEYQNNVHTLIALAHFTPDLLFSIRLFRHGDVA